MPLAVCSMVGLSEVTELVQKWDKQPQREGVLLAHWRLKSSYLRNSSSDLVHLCTMSHIQPRTKKPETLRYAVSRQKVHEQSFPSVLLLWNTVFGIGRMPLKEWHWYFDSKGWRIGLTFYFWSLTCHTLDLVHSRRSLIWQEGRIQERTD